MISGAKIQEISKMDALIVWGVFAAVVALGVWWLHLDERPLPAWKVICFTPAVMLLSLILEAAFVKQVGVAYLWDDLWKSVFCPLLCVFVCGYL